MGIYDLVSSIAQDKCEKLYKISFKSGAVNGDNGTINIAGYTYKLSDLFVCEAIYAHFEETTNFTAFCICNDSDIAVIDKLGGV